MENQDKIYEQFKEAAGKIEHKDFARIEAVWTRVEEKLDNKKQLRIATWWKYTGMAAVFLLFMGIGVILNTEKSNPVLAPEIKYLNTVTVIDTQKVNEVFDPAKTVEKEAIVAVKKIPVLNSKTTESVTAEASDTKKITISQPDQAMSSLDKSYVSTSPTTDDISISNSQMYAETPSAMAKETSKKITKEANVIPPTEAAMLTESTKNTQADFGRKYMINTEIPKDKLDNDIQNNSVMLYILGGIASRNYPVDMDFQAKYKVSYHDFGCLTPPNLNFYGDYNLLVLKYLTDKFGDEWHKDIRKDILGWDKWENKK